MIPAKKTNHDLVIGFGIVISLMLVLLITAVFRMANSQRTIESLVSLELLQNQQITIMYRTARERIITLQKMVVAQDPFEFDELWMDFNNLGSRFLQARQYILQHKTTDTERAYLAKQRTQSITSVASQVEVVRLLREGKRSAAINTLVTQAIPAQDKVLQSLQNLIDDHNNTIAKILQDSGRQYTNNRDLTIAMGLFAIWVGVWVGIIAISRTRVAQKTLLQEKERALTTLHSIGDAVITTDIHGRVEMLNPIALQLLGINEAEALGQDIESVMLTLNGETRKPIHNAIFEALQTGEVISNHAVTLLVDSHEREYVIELTASPIHIDEQNEIVGSVLVFRDITDLHNLSQQLNFNASHDPLTGLINRREFEQKLEELLHDTRDSGAKHAMLYIDLDQFKIVNDTCGHVAGDELLSQLGQRLQYCVRETDTLARLGGDEFGVLLDHCSLGKAEEIANYILNTIHDYRFSWQDNSFTVGASIGLVPINEHSGGMANVMSKADSACYIAKDSGRNRIYVSQSQLDRQVEHNKGEMQWVQRLNHALDNNRFVLYCQPIAYANNTNDIHHYEVLIRMLDEDGTLIPPMAFIPAAERYNIMSKLDQYIIEQAFTTIAHQDMEYCYSINLSGQSLTDKDFVHYVVERLEFHQINPRRICFEITETATIANLSLAMKFINTLKGMGCRFSLDDFGSGLSSFNYLKNLNVDYLKIDGSFIRDMHDDPIDRAFVSSINEIGHIIGLETIAEYVTDENVYKHLREMGVDYVQGYWIYEPFPLSELQVKAPLKNAASDPA